MNLIRNQKALVYTPGLVALVAGIFQIFSSYPIISGIIANDIHFTFRRLLDELTSHLSEHSEIKYTFGRAARRSFVRAILATCEARRRMLGYKPWLRGDFGDSQLAWINRVRDVYNKHLADMERADYELPDIVSETEAFNIILAEENHTSGFADLNARISDLVLRELKIGGHSPVPPPVEEMICHGWPDRPDPQGTTEKLTLFKFMCTFLAEEMRSHNSQPSSAWTEQILKELISS